MKIPSIEFVVQRSIATRDTQAAVAASWVWSHKTVAQWTTAITTVDQLRQQEASKRAALRSATHTWQLSLDSIQEQTRDVARVAEVFFRDEPAKAALFAAVHTRVSSREEVHQEGEALRGAWTTASPAWAPLPGVTLASFGSLLATALAQREAYYAARNAWRETAADLRTLLVALNRDCVGWYQEATTRFPADTADGQLIRANVPTTTRPPSPVGQAEILNAMVSGADIHLDARAAHATRFTFLQQTPGSPAFVVVLADATEGHLTLHNQVAGVHKFKAFGRNAAGQGPESAVVELTVSQQAVA